MQDCPDIPVLNQVPNVIVMNYCIVLPWATYPSLSAKQPNQEHWSSKALLLLRSEQVHGTALCCVNTCQQQLGLCVSGDISLLGWLLWFGPKYKRELIGWTHTRNDWGEKRNLNAKITTINFLVMFVRVSVNCCSWVTMDGDILDSLLLPHNLSQNAQPVTGPSQKGYTV